MRDEKEERKKQARSNKQTRQSNTAHVHVHVYRKGVFINREREMEGRRERVGISHYGRPCDGVGYCGDWIEKTELFNWIRS